MDIYEERWARTSLLAPFKEEKQKNAARCLQSQVAFNEKLGNVSENSQFKRLSVPLLVRMLSKSNAFERNNFDISDDLSEARNIHVFNTKFAPPIYQEGQSNFLEQEAVYTADFASQILVEFDELFRDQFNKYIVFHGFETTDSGQILLHYDL